MKNLIVSFLAILSFSSLAHADDVNEAPAPTVACASYESNTFELHDTAEATIKEGTLLYYGDVKKLSCTKTPAQDQQPDQALQYYSCQEIDGGSFTASIQTIGISWNVVAYIFRDKKMVDMLGCEL